MAAEAQSLMLSISDPQLVALLSLRSLDIQYTVEGDIALTSAAGLPFPKLILSGQAAGVYSANFSSDGKYILTGSYDGIVRMFSARTGQEIRQFIANQQGRGVKAIFSPDVGMVYAASNDGSVWGWDLATGKGRINGKLEDAPIDIQVSNDGTRLLIGSVTGTPKLLDARTGKVICSFVGHTDPVWELAFSPDDSYVATASVDGTARLWQAEDCEPVRTYSGHTDGVASVDFSPDGKTLATGSWDKTARFWDVETGEEILVIIGHTCYLVRSVRFSPDGRHLLTGSCDKTARLWDVQTGLELIEFSGQTDQIWSVAFSRDGRFILTGSHDQSAWVWDVQKMFGENIFWWAAWTASLPSGMSKAMRWCSAFCTIRQTRRG